MKSEQCRARRRRTGKQPRPLETRRPGSLPRETEKNRKLLHVLLPIFVFFLITRSISPCKPAACMQALCPPGGVHGPEQRVQAALGSVAAGGVVVLGHAGIRDGAFGCNDSGSYF